MIKNNITSIDTDTKENQILKDIIKKFTKIDKNVQKKY